MAPELGEQLEEIEQRCQKTADAMTRIGVQVRTHDVWIRELRQQASEQDRMLQEATDAAQMMTATAARFERFIERHEDHNQRHFDAMKFGLEKLNLDVRQVLVDRARDEAKVSRQAIWLWVSAVTAICAVAWALLQPRIVELL